MKGIIYLVILLALFSFQESKAQELLQNTLYVFNRQLINPAVVGTNDDLTATLNHREQWVNFDGNPSTSFFTMSGKLPYNLGGGISLFHDKHGVWNHSGALLDLAYKIRLDMDGTMLSFGLKSELSVLNVDYNKLSKQVDPVEEQGVENKFDFNQGVGAIVYNSKYYAGLSVMSLIKSAAESSEFSGLWNKTTFCLMGGYLWDINSAVKFKPSVLFRAVKHMPLAVDVNANFKLFNKLWIGAVYRLNTAIGANAVFNLTPKLKVGYAYDFYTNRLNLINSGAHEIMLSYRFSLNGKGNSNPIYF
ncbi:type IX secretion system membrane protein PorP/SprF [Prolixibacteraceae bacterium JC049]|nr:type IX secretion system membrane protein PorP/SprF [Prolixibacteraceae bacterium JC049]